MSTTSSSIRRAPGGGTAGPRKDVMMGKLLDHVAAELRRRGFIADPETLMEARTLLDQRWSQSLGDKDVKEVVSLLKSRSHSALDRPIAAASSFDVAATKAAAAQAPPRSTDDRREPTAASSSAPPPPSKTAAAATIDRAATATPDGCLAPILSTTTRRQRQLLADEEWIRAARDDTKAAAEGRVHDHKKHLAHVEYQRRLLDQQISEHERQKREEREARRRAQDEMSKQIETNRELTLQEQRDMHAKATKEKAYRDKQQREADEAREQARIAEHNAQVRQAMLVQEELQRLRDAEKEKKEREKEEWHRLLQINEERLAEKRREKEREMEEGRYFMKVHAENLQRQDRERAELRAKKAAKAAVFQKLAEGVAGQHMKKEVDLNSKIEQEYEEQLRRTMEDEKARQETHKRRLAETHRVLQEQMDAKRRQEEEEKEAARKLAEKLRQQEAEARQQEAYRRQAAKAEAQRLNDFLGTQLQLQHFRETRPLETSIARPDSRAKTMFSPTRYRPTPKPDLLPAESPGTRVRR